MNAPLVPLLLSLLLAPVDGFESDAIRRNYMMETVKGVEQIIAHRGASVERPECTAIAIERAIQTGATAVEVDIRSSKDGVLVIMHDSTVDRTTNGTGNVNDLTLDELLQLDAGSWFHRRYRDQTVPTLREVLEQCRGRIDVVLDLKEYGEEYRNKVVREVRQFGEPKRMIIGVRSMAHIKTFSELMPEARLIGLVSHPREIEMFVDNGVEMIRLWPKWFDQFEEDLVRRVRLAGATLHLNGTLGELEETYTLLKHFPVSLSSDDPKKLKLTMRKIKHGVWPGGKPEASPRARGLLNR